MTKEAIWQIEFSETAKKQFIKLDGSVQLSIQRFLRTRLMLLKNPKTLGKPLKGKFQQFWRFRVGDYRLITDIIDQRLIIEVIQIGHRREIYH